jgi:proline iminopeptidase
MPTMYLAHDFQRELERSFVVVQWDRRGAGKSYDARLPIESLTVHRTLADLFELTELLRKRFHQEKIYLVAHSWGTHLGLLAVHEHPEWYFAYVGMGQLVPDTARIHAAQRACVVAEAIARGDGALRARLSARYGSDSARVTESDMFAAGGELHGKASMWPIIRAGFRAPEYTLIDAFHVQRGAQFVGAHMREDVNADWMREQPKFRLPIVLFLGRHDCNTPSTLAADYLDSVDAPMKRLVWFENSAHFPFWEESRRFTDEMVRVDSIVRAIPQE